MPDHIHALLVFQRDQSTSRVIGDWKHFHAKESRVELQEGFFDHRLRDHERREQVCDPAADSLHRVQFLVRQYHVAFVKGHTGR